MKQQIAILERVENNQPSDEDMRMFGEIKNDAGLIDEFKRLKGIS